MAIEKPFGSDLGSAQALADALAVSLREEEIYRVDHYLGKRGVQQILAFRQHNAALLSTAQSAAHVRRVDVVMTEQEDCRCGEVTESS